MTQYNQKIAFNALCTGLVAGVATSYFIGENSNVDYFGMSIGAPYATALGCGVGSVVSDLTSDYVIQKLKINNQMMNGSTLLTKAAVGGGAAASVLYLGGMPPQNISSGFIIGGGSKLGGDYANEMLFSPTKGIIGPIF